VQNITLAQVPVLDIRNDSGHLSLFAYSPGSPPKEPVNYTYIGPRSAISRLASANASSGILPLSPPSNHSSYAVQFLAPTVACQVLESGSFKRDLIEAVVQKKMASLKGTDAYAAFVPSNSNDSGDAITSNGQTITPYFTPRQQQPRPNSLNELWLKYYRYRKGENGTDLKGDGPVPVYTTCQLNSQF
jgi:hypothetical protein